MPLCSPAFLLVASSSGHLRTPDLILIAAYLLGITVFGLRFRARTKNGTPDRSLKAYFLAGNTIPWWAIALSVVSAETSTLTIISIPGLAFAGDLGFLQVVLGYLVGRVVVALLFLPRYFAGEMLTAYQLIGSRFGPTLHRLTAGLFLLTRAAAEGVRVFAVSIVVGIAIGTGDLLSIAIISALTLLYTFEGGLAAVIWTDVVQMAIYVAGTLVALLTLGHHIPGGWHTILHSADAAGKLHTFHFTPDPTQPFWSQSYTFWAGLLGGTFLTMASHGTDQLMVQRLLAARSLRQSQWALLGSGVVVFAQFAFFLLIGAGLWVFYGLRLGPHAAAFRSNDYIFPTFIVHELPTGVAGLLVAAILAAAMSNLSAALNSLSSTTVVDFYLHLRQPNPPATPGTASLPPATSAPAPTVSDRERLFVSKASTVLWAVVLFAIAVYALHAGGKGHVVEIGLSIAAVAYGCLLGVFLLGTLIPPGSRYSPTERGAITGMLCGFALNLWLWQGSFPAHLGPITIPRIAFTWYVLIGAAATFGLGALASLLPGSARKPTLKHPLTTAALLLLCVFLPQTTGVLHAQTPTQTHPRTNPPTPNSANIAPTPEQKQVPIPADDFSLVSRLVNAAIAHHEIPGAVVLIGHRGDIVFQHAYGDRKLAGEPGPDGQPSPAEPMTEDTLFDMASLTKVIVTSTAIGQLYDEKRLGFDDPVEKYLPAFNPGHDPARAQANSARETGAEGPTDSPTQADRAKVTIRMLLTHFSGEPPDVDLKDSWGLAAPDRAEGLRRALTAPLATAPGSKFTYSDINFILLGAIVEKITGWPLDQFAQGEIFGPLGMDNTRYLPFDKACGAETSGAAVIGGHGTAACVPNSWDPRSLRANTAPTAHDDEGTPATNPDFDRLLRGTVDDPTTRRMGGVAGHAGVFSTAQDMALFAQSLLDRLAGRPSEFPVKRLTLELMTTPEQPGHTPFQVGHALRANAAALARGDKPATGDPALLDPNFPAIPGQTLRGFGWDIDSVYSKPRGRVFPIGTFGHTGYTGTSLWLDPVTDTYVLLLTNAIHPHPGHPISNLRGEVASAAAMALGLYNSSLPTPNTQASSRPEPPTTPPTQASSRLEPPTTPPTQASSRPERTQSAQRRDLQFLPLATTTPTTQASSRPERTQSAQRRDLQFLPAAPTTPTTQASSRPKRTQSAQRRDLQFLPPATTPNPTGHLLRTVYNPPTKAPTDQPTLTGIDVLEATNEAALLDLVARKQHPIDIGLLTNQSGVDRAGHRTIDILNNTALREKGVELTTLFSPEHGILGQGDSTHLAPETDTATGIPVTVLYGPHDADRRPTHEQLKDLDAVVIDLQDAGVRFFTYETVVGYFLEAAAHEQSAFHHDLHILVLDRPNPIGGLAIQGPISDTAAESYTDFMPLPVRHGLTLGELARYSNMARSINAPLTVVAMQHWTRGEFYDETGLPWVNPSPNLRSLTAATLYPGLALLEQTNLSVGRGTATPFEVFGAGPTSVAAPGPAPSAAPAAPSAATTGLASAAPGAPPTAQGHRATGGPAAPATGPDPQTPQSPQGDTSAPGSSSRPAAPRPASPQEGASHPVQWFHAAEVAAALNARAIPGVRFEATHITVTDEPNRYPFHGQTIEAVHVVLTDRNALDSPEMGLEILAVLHRLYPTQFALGKASRLVANASTMEALERGEDPRHIAAGYAAALQHFEAARTPALLYR